MASFIAHMEAACLAMKMRTCVGSIALMTLTFEMYALQLFEFIPINFSITCRALKNRRFGSTLLWAFSKIFSVQLNQLQQFPQ